MDNLSKTNLHHAIQLSKTCRFLDDLLNVNGEGLLSQYLSQIYPPELEIRKENDNSNKATFLEFNIEKQMSKFKLSVYDKRDDFPFKIVQYPSIGSNVPSEQIYNIFASQVIRYIRVCNNKTSLVERTQLLASTLREKGANNKLLKQKLRKTLVRHKELLLKKLNIQPSEPIKLVAITRQ